jgi:hypothetical protein
MGIANVNQCTNACLSLSSSHYVHKNNITISSKHPSTPTLSLPTTPHRIHHHFTQSQHIPSPPPLTSANLPHPKTHPSSPPRPTNTPPTRMHQRQRPLVGLGPALQVWGRGGGRGGAGRVPSTSCHPLHPGAQPTSLCLPEGNMSRGRDRETERQRDRETERQRDRIETEQRQNRDKGGLDRVVCGCIVI